MLPNIAKNVTCCELCLNHMGDEYDTDINDDMSIVWCHYNEDYSIERCVCKAHGCNHFDSMCLMMFNCGDC
jgi:hypothetical protein